MESKTQVDGRELEARPTNRAEAVRALLRRHRPLVVALAAHHARPGVDQESLVVEGVLGLLEAARRFDASKGVAFGAYAAWWVRRRIAACAERQELALAA